MRRSLRLPEPRVVSYWNEYYRRKYPSIAGYPGHRLMARLETAEREYAAAGRPGIPGLPAMRENRDHGPTFRLVNLPRCRVTNMRAVHRATRPATELQIEPYMCRQFRNRSRLVTAGLSCWTLWLGSWPRR
jgi:hypothetical protein